MTVRVVVFLPWRSRYRVAMSEPHLPNVDSIPVTLRAQRAPQETARYFHHSPVPNTRISRRSPVLFQRKHRRDRDPRIAIADGVMPVDVIRIVGQRTDDGILHVVLFST